MVESHYRSRTWFDAISDIDNLFIISLVPEEMKLFVKKGFPREKILNLNNHNISDLDYYECIDKLPKYERKFGFNLNKIVNSDRTLRRKSYKHVAKYVIFIIDSVLRFVEKHNFDIVFLEPTWTHEIIICKIMDYYNIPVFAPAKDKILPNRFFFFRGYLNKDLFKRNRNIETKYITNEISKSVLNSNNNIQYFDQYSKRNKITLSKFYVLWDIFRLAICNSKNNNIQPSFFYSIGKKIKSIYRAKYIPYLRILNNIDDIHQKFILVTLHVQPEASIDVLGSKFSNQIDFVKHVSRTCPSDHCIVVKEHPHAFGDRSVKFYKSLMELNNVVVVNHTESSLKAIKKSELVISITGTSSLEAAIVGIPAVTAVEMFFKDVLVVPSFDPMCESVVDLLCKAEIWKKSYSKKCMANLISEFQKNSFPGNSGDYKTDPDVLSEENLQKIRSAFIEVIDAHR